MPLNRFTLCLLCALLAISARAMSADANPSLYEYIHSRIDPATGALWPGANVLPDEPSGRRYSSIRWVPGALEGLGTRHMKWDGSEKASRVARLLELLAGGQSAAEPALYEMLRADDVVTFYSDALDYAATRVRRPGPELHELALRLVTESADRGPVKFGIAMLGSFGDARDLAVVQTLALHDEFGLYAAEAIAEMSPDPQAALYDMARKVQGWGRVEAVSRMVATRDPSLRRWLLTEGFRNDVTAQYLAYQCVTIADLAGTLAELKARRSKADLPLLVGAADLLQALIKPGPGIGLNRYEDAPEAVAAFLRNVQTRRESVSFYLAAVAIRDYVTALPAGSLVTSQPASTTPQPLQSAPADREVNAVDLARWTLDQQRDVSALATRVAADSSWHRHVIAAIDSDGGDLDDAEVAAQKLGIKTFDLHLRHLTKYPTASRRWDLAFAAAQPADVKRLVDVAQNAFGARFADPRTHRAAGALPPPSTATSAAPSSSASTIAAATNAREANDARTGAALEAVLHGVAHYPGSGMPLVESSLADADDRVRRAAVETLVRWGGPYLRNVSVRSALNSAARDESDDALKARMVALLNIGTLP